MTSLHIRDVPEDTLRRLKARAAESGQSLQAYARELLIEESRTLSAAELVARAREIAAHGKVTEDDILNALTEARQSRTA